MSRSILYCLFGEIVFLTVLQAKAEYREVSNSGREFIVAFLQHDETSPGIELVITAVQNNIAEVYISAPLRQDIQQSIHLSLSGGEAQRISLDSSLSLKGTTMQDNGVWIRSDKDITVQCYSLGFKGTLLSASGFMGYPVESLGDEYVVVTNCKGEGVCQFAIVAITDFTDVDILLKIGSDDVTYINGYEYYDGDMVSVTLDKFQTVCVQSNGDLTGTRITSYIANYTVIVGANLRSSSPSSTYFTIQEQLPPLYSLGDVYVVVPFPDMLYDDYIRIVAVDGVDPYVKVDGIEHSISNVYQDFRLTLKRHTLIESDGRILVAQFSNSASDNTSRFSNTSLTIVPPFSRWRQEYVFSSPKLKNGTERTYISIVTNDSCYPFVLLDGVTPMAEWILNSNTHAHTSFELQGLRHRLSVTNERCTLSGNIYGTFNNHAWSMLLGWQFLYVLLPESEIASTLTTIYESTPILESSSASQQSESSTSSFTVTDVTDLSIGVSSSLTQSSMDLFPSSEYSISQDVFSSRSVEQLATDRNTWSTIVATSTDVTATLETNEVITTPSPQTASIVPKNNQGCCICVSNKSALIDSDASLRDLIKYLTVNKQNLSITTRKYISVPDNRPSAVAIGYTGVVFLGVTALLFLINDALRFGSYVFSISRKVDPVMVSRQEEIKG